MGAIGAPELIIVLLIVLLIFGGTKLPKLARSLGEAQREFRQGQDEATRGKADAPKDETPSS
jgi:sec-independent protein translocase protein TatA